MFRNILKRLQAVFIAGVLAFSLCACGSSKDAKNTGKDNPAEATTQAREDGVAKGVVLPEQFDNMIYPLEALMVEDLSKGYDYYSGETEDGEEDSFWFSLAVLTSLMEEQSAFGDGVEKDSHYYLKEDTMEMYVSALYDAFSKGDLEYPEIPDDDEYVTYDDEKEMYGFIKGDIGTLTAFITDCEKDGDDYILTVQLKDSETGKVRGTYEFTLVNSSYDGEDNYFHYSVASMEKTEDDSYNFDEDEAPEKASTEDSSETEEETEETDTDEKDDADSEETGSLSQDEAKEKAKEYYGDDAEYSFKDKVTVGDKEYYDFSVKGDGISATDVLVSVDGDDMIGGTRNDDGSWSFDQ